MATEQLLILLKAKDEASRVIDDVRGNLNGLAGVAGTVVTAAGVAATAAVAGLTTAIGIGVGKAADMEQQIADIASVMGLTFDEAQPLKDLITQLGVDPNLKVSATEAADAIQMLARNGLDMSDILDGAARSTVLLANATNADFGTAADIATDVMALFKISADDMATAVNGITSVTTASKFSIDDYRLALAQGGGVAAAVGVDFADFNTTIAAISPLFASGSDAGTSFKTFLQRLVPQSKEAEGAMRALGIITEDCSNQFFDASGNLRSMADIAGLLQGALVGLSEEQKNAALNTIFGTDAMRAAVGLAEVGSGRFTELAASMAQIDAESMAATRMDTFSGAMEILQGIIDGLLTQIGDAFLPALRAIAEWAIELASQHGPAIVAWFASIAAAIPPLIAYFQAVLEDGDYLNDWLTHLPGPIQIAVAAIGRIIAELRTLTASNWTEKLVEWAAALVAWAGGLWTEHVAPKLVEFWNALIGWVTGDEMRTRLATALGEWTRAIADWAGGLWTEHVAPKLAEFWSWLTGWITDDAKRAELLTTLGDWAKPLADWAGELWTEHVAPKMAEFWQSFKKWLDDHAFNLGTTIETWTTEFAQMATEISNGWNEAWPEISKTVTDAADDIGADAQRIIDNLNKIAAWFTGDEGTNAIADWATFFIKVVEAAAVPLQGLVGMIADIVELIALYGDLFSAMARMDWDSVRDISNRMVGLQRDILAAPFSVPGELWEIIQRRAGGGPVEAGQPYIVGENGPELFVPQGSGQIVPNHQLTTNNSYTVNLHGSGDSQRDVLASLRLVSALYG